MERDIILLIVGVLVGVMNAIAGGGMLVGFPAMVALGVPPLVANVTANIITPPGQITAAYAYRDYLRKVPRRYLLLLPFIALGALAGAITLRTIPTADFAALVPWLVLFGVGLFAIQPQVHMHLHTHLHGSKRRQALLPLILIGLALLPVSFYGGFFGAGYGFMMLAFLNMGKIHEIHMLNAMKNVSATLVAAICLVVLAPTGLIDWHVGLVMAIGAAIGGHYGAKLAQRVPSHWLRAVIIFIGLSAAAYLGLTHPS